MKQECYLQLECLNKLAEKVENYDPKLIEQQAKKILSNGSIDDQRELYDTIKFSRHAVSSLNSENEELKSNAAKVVKTFRHLKKDFKQLIQSAEEFEKHYRKHQERKTNDALSVNLRTLRLKSGLQLEEIRTVANLMQIGKVLDNCVGTEDTAKDYIEEVQNGEVQLYGLFGEAEEILGLIKVDLEKAVVEEFDLIDPDDLSEQEYRQQRRRRRPHGRIRRRHRIQHSSASIQEIVSRDDLFEILELLQVTADEIDEFVALGALSSFKDGMPSINPVELADGREMWIWKFKKEIIVGIDGNEQSSDGMHLSRLWRETGRSAIWRTSGIDCIDMEDLFDIMLDNPEVYEKIRD